MLRITVPSLIVVGLLCIWVPHSLAREANSDEDATVFESSDGLIRVPIPEGEEWACTETSDAQNGAYVMLVKCKHTPEDAFFFMVAKDYTVPEDQVVAASELRAIYESNYESLFGTITYDELEDIEIEGYQGYLMSFSASHESRGEIEKFEQVLVVGAHVLILSAEGSPEVVDAMQELRETWWQSTDFTTLGD